MEATEDIVDAIEDADDGMGRLFVVWISYISSRQPPPQYSKLLPEHSTLQSVWGCIPLPTLGAVPQ